MSKPIKTLFVVLFPGRTGSTYLIDLLNRHPRLCAYGEIIEGASGPTAPVGIRSRWVSLCKEAVCGPITVRQHRCIARFIQEAANHTEVDGIGFKTKIEGIADKPTFREVLEKHGVHVLLLRRRNTVKQTVSHFTAAELYRRTGRFNRFLNTSSKAEPLYIDPDIFEKQLRWTDYAQKNIILFAHVLNCPMIDVEYEDLLHSFDRTWQDICGFLSVDKAEVQSAVKKHTSDRLEEAVVNYDALKARFVGTSYAELFEEHSTDNCR